MYEASISGSQWVGLIGIGGLLWATGVMVIRYFYQILFGSQSRQVLSYVAAFPLNYVSLVMSERLLGLRPDQRLLSTAIIGTTALFLDGTAMMWVPELYENPSLNRIKSPLAMRFSRQGAAWLLWTFGAAFAMALYTHLN
jgi:hypothetical protein